MPETPVTLTPVPGAELVRDENGEPIVRVATCGYCRRSWNDAAISAVTPVPAGRCPFEYEHEYPDDAIDAGEAEGEYVGEHTEDISYKLDRPDGT